ncbi:MAG TPA: hypothetical protein DHV28_13750 [Ignavibacteriales bacterium]|nr:hypothetical protein [Ignavibacteriales bacterium]
MKKLVMFLVLIYSTLTLPQRSDTQAIITPQGFGINLLNSKGNSSIDNDISNIGFMNPAAISNFDNYSFGLSYQLSSSIDEAWIADIGTSRKNDWMPQSAGAVFKFDDFSFGLGFGQKYNGSLDFDSIQITTTQDPDGTGEYFQVEYKTRVQSYSLSASYSFPEVFNESSSLEIGFRYSYNHLKFYEKLLGIQIDESDNIGSYAIGLQYSNQISNSRIFIIGFSYEIEPDFEKIYEYTNDLIYVYDPDSTGRIPAYINSKFNLVGSVPDKFNLDVSADLTESFRLNAMITGVMWEPDNDYIKNQLEFSASGIYRINEMFAPSFGFYYTDKNFDEDFFDINEKMNALYLIGGLRFNYDIFSADLAIADSHLFSGDFRKQTIGKLAIGVQL